MTLHTSQIEYLSNEEWDEMIALKNAINTQPSSVVPEMMEKFTSLFVRSLYGKGDDLNNTKIHNSMTEHNSNFNSPIEPLDECDPNIADRANRHHPGTPFEEFCSLNPDASECRIYDD